MAWTSPQYDVVPVVDLDALTDTLTGTTPGRGHDTPAPVVVNVRGCELGWLLRHAGFLTDHDLSSATNQDGLRRFARAVQDHGGGASVNDVRRWMAGSVPRWPEARDAIVAVLSDQLGRPVSATEVWTWLRGQRRTAPRAVPEVAA